MNFFKLLIAILVSGATLGACSDDSETTNPTVALSFNTQNSVTGIPEGGRVQANSLEFTSGSITLAEIEFETETDDGDSVEVNIEQVVVIDFATGAVRPSLPNLEFPVGTYTETRVELELLDENNDPSVIIEGTFVDRNNEAHPIRFEFNSGETFEVEREGAITFSSGALVLAEVTFDPVAWFAGVTSSMLEAADKDENGVIVISENSNQNLYSIVADGLDLATEVEVQVQ